MSKIDWSKALNDYVSDETLSYEKVATKYGVSKRSVTKRASREKWPTLRQDTSLKVLQKLPQKVAETVAEASAMHVWLGKSLIAAGLRVIIEKKVEIKTWNEAVGAIKLGVEIRRKALGLDKIQPEPGEIKITFGAENLKDKSLLEGWEEWAK